MWSLPEKKHSIAPLEVYAKPWKHINARNRQAHHNLSLDYVHSSSQGHTIIRTKSLVFARSPSRSICLTRRRRPQRILCQDSPPLKVRHFPPLPTKHGPRGFAALTHHFLTHDFGILWPSFSPCFLLMGMFDSNVSVVAHQFSKLRCWVMDRQDGRAALNLA